MARRRWLPVLVLLVCAASCRSSNSSTHRAAGALSRHTAQQQALGTAFRLTFYAPTDETAAAATAAALRRLDECDAALNPDRPDSQVSAVNNAPDGRPVKIGDDLFAVLQHAQRLAGVTHGAFDATAGAFTELWSRCRAAGRAPSAAELEEMRLRVGWEKLRLDAIEHTATLMVPRMRIDTAGLARGYAADAAFRALRDHGCEQARVDAGNVAVVGAAPPGRDGWSVVIHGVPGPKGRAPTLSLTKTAVAYWPWPPADPRRGAAGTPAVMDPTTGRMLEARPPVAVLAPGGAIAESAAAMASTLGPGGYRTITAVEGRARVRFGIGPPAKTNSRPR